MNEGTIFQLIIYLITTYKVGYEFNNTINIVLKTQKFACSKYS